MIPAKRLDVYAAGGSETWTTAKDGLAGFEIHPSGALLIYAADMPTTERHVVAVRSFGTWLALEVDQEPNEPETGAQTS